MTDMQLQPQSHYTKTASLVALKVVAILITRP